MDCPKCVGKLEEKTVEKFKVDVCFACEGIWFDKGELEGVIAADSKDKFDLDDLDDEELDGKELQSVNLDLNHKKGKCPRCADGRMLEPEAYKNILVDICPKDHGIWLDGAEIQQLRKRGLHHLKEYLGNMLLFFKWAFSGAGFHQVMETIFGGSQNPRKPI